ncbi:MAG: hypothetical protein ACREKL_02660 [Chthoniobacterales bacterium]
MKHAILLTAIAAMALHAANARGSETAHSDFSRHLTVKLENKHGMKAAAIVARELRIFTERDPSLAMVYTRVAVVRLIKGKPTIPAIRLSRQVRVDGFLLKAVMDGYLASRGKPDSRLVAAVRFIFYSLPLSLKTASTYSHLYPVMKAVDRRHGGDTPERQALFERLFSQFSKSPVSAYFDN